MQCKPILSCKTTSLPPSLPPLHPLNVPLSWGSGESSTGALCVRYWDEPWDFLCLWAFLMDFLVNPSTFSDAEMADILMHKSKKLTKINIAIVSPMSTGKVSSSSSASNYINIYVSQHNCVTTSKSCVVILYDPTWSLCILGGDGGDGGRLDCVQTLHLFSGWWCRDVHNTSQAAEQLMTFPAV